MMPSLSPLAVAWIVITTTSVSTSDDKVTLKILCFHCLVIVAHLPLYRVLVPAVPSQVQLCPRPLKKHKKPPGALILTDSEIDTLYRKIICIANTAIYTCQHSNCQIGAAFLGNKTEINNPPNKLFRTQSLLSTDGRYGSLNIYWCYCIMFMLHPWFI